jgi:hypothetical protein
MFGYFFHYDCFIIATGHKYRFIKDNIEKKMAIAFFFLKLIPWRKSPV